MAAATGGLPVTCKTRLLETVDELGWAPALAHELHYLRSTLLRARQRAQECRESTYLLAVSSK